MNKHTVQILTIMLILSLTMTASAIAEDIHSGHAHNSMDMTDPMPTPMDHSDHQDTTTIRETMVDNYHLVYDLIDMRERMKDMPDMKNTHHLMVYIHSPEADTVDKAQVGFLIVAPDGDQQKVMAMGMSGGFGADINMAKNGTYKISVKALFEDKDLRDSFEHETN